MRYRKQREHMRRYRRGPKLINRDIHYHSVIRKNPHLSGDELSRLIKKGLAAMSPEQKAEQLYKKSEATKRQWAEIPKKVRSEMARERQMAYKTYKLSQKRYGT